MIDFPSAVLLELQTNWPWYLGLFVCANILWRIVDRAEWKPPSE